MSTWVLVPGTPILLPAVAGGSDPAAELRAVCVAEIGAALSGSGGASVAVIAFGSSGERWPDEPYALSRLVGGPSTGSGHGRTVPGRRMLPLALAVGRHLVRAAGWDGDLTLQTLAEPVPVAADLVIAVGDGSLLRRGLGSPGPQHPRAVEFDASVLAAVAAGDPAALAALDVALAAELGVTGAVPWLALAATADDHDVEASVQLADDPFGPYVLVASWRWT